MRVRASLYLVRGDVCGEDLGTWYEEYPQDSVVGELARIGGVKIFSDGGACGAIAASETILEGYENGPLYHDLETLTEMIRRADAAGYQVIVHAQGDIAIAEVQDAYEVVLDGRPNVMHHRIDHNVLQTDATITRYGESVWSLCCSVHRRPAERTSPGPISTRTTANAPVTSLPPIPG
jgi:predicted amidohydrolase YtcJ